MLRGPFIWPTAAKEFFEANTASVRSPRTVETWSVTYRQLHLMFGKRVEEYTEADLVQFLSNPRWAPGTATRNRTALRQFFSWYAHVKGVKDPSSYLNRLVRPGSRGVMEHHWLVKEDVALILKHCGKDDLVGIRDAAALALGFYAGLRLSEIASLTWDRVREDHLLVLGKGGKLAQAALLPDLSTILDRWWRWSETTNGAVLIPIFERNTSPKIPGEPYLDPRWDEPLGPAGVRKVLYKRSKQAGFDGIAPHDMRRTFAGMLQDEGVPVEIISQALRHDNVATTSRYLDRSPRRMHDALKGLRF